MKELKIEADINNIDRVIDFVNSELESAGSVPKAETMIDIAIDEIITNIASYAYTPGRGSATIQFELIDNSSVVCLSFIDEGVEFNPLNAKEPDVTLSAEDRAPGGLGIFIVKKKMDKVTYEYADGKNILKIYKNIRC
jgi:anti-sigma regulatory factor (Ser/Thr protein kinase)